MTKKARKGKEVSADDVVNFEILDFYEKKYRNETRIILAGEKSSSHVSANLYIVSVTVHNETNEICYIPSKKESFYRRVTPINLTKYLISDDYTDSLIEENQQHFKEKLIEHANLLTSKPFYAYELLKGGKNHYLYLEHHNDRKNIYKGDYMKTEFDDISPYY